MGNELMGVVSTKRPKRSIDLVATFSEGFADGWFMALKESFKMELDIKFTERKKDRVSYYEWTQGPYFCFSEGQIVYDVKEGYTCWQEALEKVNLACQIVEAKKNIPIKIENEVTGKPEYGIMEGYVRFVLLKPDEGRKRLLPFVGYQLSQSNFVGFLKTGKL